MSTVFKGVYRIHNGRIQELIEAGKHYDVDWGYVYDDFFYDFWVYVCDDTPENRKKYSLEQMNNNCYQMIKPCK